MDSLINGVDAMLQEPEVCGSSADMRNNDFPCKLLDNDANENIITIPNKYTLKEIEKTYVHDECTKNDTGNCIIDMGRTTYSSIGYKGKKATGDIIDNMSLDNYTPRECSNLCTNTPECNSWQFSNNVCTLKKGMTLTIDSDQNMVADVKTTCGKLSYSANGRDVLNPIKVDDECQCKKMCDDISQCFSWQYENGMCSFKDKGFLTLIQNNEIISGQKGKECGKLIKEINGEPLFTKEKLSACECQEHCTQNNECKSWSYKSSNIVAGGICQLFGIDNVEESDTGSGIIGNTSANSTKCSPAALLDTPVKDSTKIKAKTSCECNNMCNKFEKCSTWDFYYDNNKTQFTCVLKEAIITT